MIQLDTPHTSDKTLVQIALFRYPVTWSLDPSASVRVNRRLTLRPPQASESTQLNTSLSYYLALSTAENFKSDFGYSAWYAESETTYVESILPTYRRANTATQLQVTRTYRGQLNPISLKRIYSTAEPEAVRFDEPMTPERYKDIVRQRKQNSSPFNTAAYMVIIALKPMISWLNLGTNERVAMLTEMEGLAAASGLGESVLIDTFFDSASNLLIYYGRHMTELNSYAQKLYSLPIAQHLENGFSDAVILNHTTYHALEAPSDMAQRS